jgi:hypothetical protein
MRLDNIVAMAFNGARAKLRRGAIVSGLCGICALAAVIMATSASVLALEPHVGVIYARLIVAGVFALIAAAIVVSVRLMRPRQPVAAMSVGAQAETSQRQAQFAQLAMIVEAVLLGYSLSRRSDRR